MKYRKSSVEEVDNYFAAHPNHLEMLNKDWDATEGMEVDWEKIHNFVDFVSVPDVGVVPIYWEEQLTEGLRIPEWESHIDDLYAHRIYKILWFVVVEMWEFDSCEIEILPIDQLDKAIAAAMERERDKNEDFENYFHGWEDRTFFNGKKFEPLSVLSNIHLSDLEEIEDISAPGYPEPEDLRASILRASDGSYFVSVNYMSSISLMKVDSLEQAHLVLAEIWN